MLIVDRKIKFYPKFKSNQRDTFVKIDVPTFLSNVVSFSCTLKFEH